MFIDPAYPAYNIAESGLPLFASGFIFFGINMVSIGYFQSVERDRPAMAVTLLRGYILILVCFGLCLNFLVCREYGFLCLLRSLLLSCLSLPFIAEERDSLESYVYFCISEFN